MIEHGIDELELSVRSDNCLRNAGITTVEQLVTQSSSDLLRIKNFGRKSLIEVEEILASLGLSLARKELKG